LQLFLGALGISQARRQIGTVQPGQIGYPAAACLVDDAVEARPGGLPLVLVAGKGGRIRLWIGLGGRTTLASMIR